jgi:hypothetical protein
VEAEAFAVLVVLRLVHALLDREDVGVLVADRGSAVRSVGVVVQVVLSEVVERVGDVRLIEELEERRVDGQDLLGPSALFA